ncbi:MAG: hypothetical protein HC767_02280, partial [Akkermansiaceae bacterium]|nr:hypothetical protein [Akkermansiaceae bacterium]
MVLRPRLAAGVAHQVSSCGADHAHACGPSGIDGACFAVWAPNAQNVSVVGDFNHWDGRRHPMRRRGSSGVWELFVPEITAGQKYKYRVRGQWGEVVDKSDPYGFAAELPPCTASIVTDLAQFRWHDQEWLDRRAQT